MSILTSFTGLSNIIANLNQCTAQVKDEVKQLYGNAAQGCYTDSQNSVPVLSGDLQSSGHVDIVDNGDTFSVSVVYGDGNGYGSKYGIADGYAWFIELSTRFMPAQPYLGPAFDVWSGTLMNGLKGLF